MSPRNLNSLRCNKGLVKARSAIVITPISVVHDAATNIFTSMRELTTY